MSDAEDRLAALDPAANQPYQHADLDAMITRIVATPTRARSAYWQRFQARLAGGAIAATLVTALTLVATQGAPSLPALAIQHALTGPSSSFATQLPMSTYEDLHFIAGPGISQRAPSTASYELKLPASAKAESARLAGLFGVSGAPAEHGGGNWTVTSTSGAVLNYDSVDVPQWYYSSTSPKVAPAEKSGSVSIAMPSHATVEADVQRYVRELGYHYSLSSPSFSTATTSTTTPDGAPLTVYGETASYSVLVHGTTTDQSLSFTFDPTNALLYAEGPAFHVGAGVSYPLQSPRAGVTALGTAEKRTFAAVAKPPAAKATITSDRVSLAPYQLKNGTLWLLPLYTYSGTITGEKSATAARTWSELAVELAYVAGSSATSEGVSH
jgi:hypothetical protein